MAKVTTERSGREKIFLIILNFFCLLLSVANP